jgi:hypothetical protein
MHVAPLYGRLDGAVGLVVVGAVVELAGVDVRGEIGKVVSKVFRVHVPHPKLPEPRRVDHVAPIRQGMKFGVGRRVRALLRFPTHASCSQVEVRLEGVQEGRLAGPGWAGDGVDLSLKGVVEPIEAVPFRRTGGEHRVAEVGVPEVKIHHVRLVGLREEIDLVDDEPCRNVMSGGRDEQTVEKSWI